LDIVGHGIGIVDPALIKSNIGLGGYGI